MQLSVIIVNYNVKYFLEQCLYSVVKAGEGLTMEVFVVDNNSADGSRAYLETKFPEVKFKWNNSNDGFGKASNSVLKQTLGAQVLFLNPDTIVPEDCFTKCLNFFEKQENCGALGVRMLDGSGRFLKESKRGFPSPQNSFFKLAGLAFLFPSSKLFAGYYAGHLPQSKNAEVDVLAGAFLMLSKKAIEVTGGFDESFFMYGEDVDLSYRLQQAGFTNCYFADTSIIHFKGESTQKVSVDYIKHFYGAMRLFVNKHYKEKKAVVFFMKTAIALSKGLAFIKMSLKANNKNQQVIRDSLNTAVMATQATFDKCIQLLKYAKPPVLICGRIAVYEEKNKASLGNLNDAKSIIKKQKLQQIVFCEADLSFKSIIEQLDGLSGKTAFLIHAKGSCSMVGSNNKNAKGVFISNP